MAPNRTKHLNEFLLQNSQIKQYQKTWLKKRSRKLFYFMVFIMFEYKKKSLKKRTFWVGDIFEKGNKFKHSTIIFKKCGWKRMKCFWGYICFDLSCIYQTFLMTSLFFSCYNDFFSSLKIIIFFYLSSNCKDICLFISILSIRHNLISTELDHRFLWWCNSLCELPR